MIIPVILAGGTGTRLWPLSRGAYPKQFQKLYGDKTMLQLTIERLDGLNCLPPIVVCNEAHRFIVAEQLREIGVLNYSIILEPAGRDTAPAIALAAFHASKDHQNPSLLVLSADHVIKNPEGLYKAINQSQTCLNHGKLTLLGIRPNSAETGYGYIKYDTQDALDDNAFNIQAFVEKPDLDTAKKYLADGGYLWNSGMFVFKAQDYLSELKTYHQKIYDACKISIENSVLDLDFIRIDKENFDKVEKISIDYAIMEKTQKAAVIPMDVQWSDVGSWSALWDVSEHDESSNVSAGDGKTILFDSSKNYVYNESSLVCLLGIDDAVVVQTKDAILVANKNRTQDVKQLVSLLEKESKKETEFHREVYRPWGKYDSVDNGHRYQVKRIVVKAGEKLSLQKHFHRSEHWIVVSGTAEVTVNDKIMLVTENESVYIPLGSIHCLKNPGKVDLHLIEVQVGSYLGEDDIVRFEDVYGRS